MQNRGVVSIFGAGYLGCNLATWAPNAPKMEGESKGGDFPSWHTTLLAKSSVLYLLPQLAREKGCAGGHPLSCTRKSAREMGAAATISLADFGRGKRYIKPPSLVSRPAAAAFPNGLILTPPGCKYGTAHWALVSLPLGRFSNRVSTPCRNSASFSGARFPSSAVCTMASVSCSGVIDVSGAS